MKITIICVGIAVLAMACQVPDQSSEKKVDGPKIKAEKIVRPLKTKNRNHPKKKFPDNMKKGERLAFGAPFTINSEAITLSAALAAGPAEKPQKISGKISKVCKAKGCWFTLKHGNSPDVRVKMKDYGFFVPKNSDGAEAVVEGVLSQRILPKKEAQHYADDAVKAGEQAQTITKDKRIFELIVSAVEISKAS